MPGSDVEQESLLGLKGRHVVQLVELDFASSSMGK